MVERRWLWRSGMVAVVCAGLLSASACGKDEPAAKPDPTPTHTQRLSLPAACGELAGILPKGTDSYEPAVMRAFLDDLAKLNNSADQATRTALRPLLDPTARLASQVTASDHSAFLDALNNVAQTCHDAGSTALD